MDAVQLTGLGFWFTKTIMHLANLPELHVMIRLAWEIASNGLVRAETGSGCAADVPGAMCVFVGESRLQVVARDPPGGRASGTKWVVRPVVGRPGGKEVGVGR